jgi:hypothetical protein
VVQNVYRFNLRRDRVEGLAAELPTCLAAVQADLQVFMETWV